MKIQSRLIFFIAKAFNCFFEPGKQNHFIYWKPCVSKLYANDSQNMSWNKIFRHQIEVRCFW